MSRFFQIQEQDLQKLETVLPELMDLTSLSCNDPIVRVRWRELQEILKNVRWNYGPYEEVERIEGDEGNGGVVRA